jgi:hypothetical protein
VWDRETVGNRENRSEEFFQECHEREGQGFSRAVAALSLF